MAITAGLVSELRKLTGAGMMDCKKALEKADGNIEEAQKWLREQGKVSAGKKAGRIAAEGKVFVAINDDNKKAAMVEINSETDFVARGDDFNDFGQHIAHRALELGEANIDAFLEACFSGDGGISVEEARKELIVKIGENISIRRIAFYSTDARVVGYTHSGRIGVLLDIQTEDDELARGVAMHIAASQPVVVKPEDVPESLIEKEREIYTTQANNTGKPAEVIEKMVMGRMKKFVNEISLLGQPFVKDPSQNVGSVLSQQGAKVNQFIRFEVGEGIEKQESNFAEEVKAQIQGS